MVSLLDSSAVCNAKPTVANEPMVYDGSYIGPITPYALHPVIALICIKGMVYASNNGAIYLSFLPRHKECRLPYFRKYVLIDCRPFLSCLCVTNQKHGAEKDRRTSPPETLTELKHGFVRHDEPLNWCLILSYFCRASRTNLFRLFDIDFSFSR